MYDLNERLGLIIKRMRGAKTQAQLARESGVSQQTISDIENKNAIPKFDVIIALSDALGISIDTLVKEIRQIKDVNKIYEIDPNLIKASWIMEQIPEKHREYAVQILEGILAIINLKE